MNTETKELTVIEEFRELAVYNYDVITKAADAIEAEVMSHACDVQTPKGREEERSLAYKVSQAKQRVVKMANASIEEARDTVKAVTGERQRLEGLFDDIRDKRKAGSVRWEVKEETRIEVHKAWIEWLRQNARSIELNESEGIEANLRRVEAFDTSDLEEFEAEGDFVKTETLEKLNAALTLAKEREAQAEELKRLRELEERRQKEEAEALEAKRLADIEAARKAQAQLDAINAKKDEERREKETLKRIEQGKKRAAEEERKRIEFIQQEKEDEAKRQAAIEETKRIAAENEELKRQADKDHRKKVREEIAFAMVETTNCIPDPEHAKLLVAAIENGEIPNLYIQF